MNMQLKYVTLTGADNTVKPARLVELSEKYPFVEWAILFSKSKPCAPRYPSFDWVFELGDAAEGKKVNLSAHLCGQWVSEAMAGKSSFLDNSTKMAKLFQRVQLNMGKERLAEAMTCQPLLDLVKKASKQVIFGGNYKYITVDADFFFNSEFLPLYDASGGRGVETKEWPKAMQTAGGLTPFTGYAGGLGPDNVADELPRIAEAAGEAHVWIDMETKLRSKNAKGEDVFDLTKCEQVLQAAKAYMG
jgi:hypothetical protein